MKIGCIPYRHALPFAGAWAGHETVWAHPTELAKKLFAGEVDLALVPVWDVLIRPGTRALDRVAIGSKGEVRSVGVFYDRPLAECRSIRFTPHSVTSVQLWKLVAERLRLNLPEETHGEAKLLIGDEALAEWNLREGAGVLDLGQAWTEWTEKPFVFAVWALGPGVHVPPGELKRFREACLLGIERRVELGKDEQEKEYLLRCIRYGLGPEEKEGLTEFARRSNLQKVEIEWV